MESEHAGRGELEALTNRLDELVADRRDDEAAAVCEAISDRYADDRDPEVVDRVAGVMAARCWCLRKSGDGRQLIAAVAELQDQFGDASAPWLARCAARGLFEQIAWLVQARATETALAVSETLISRFDDAASLEVRDALAESLSWSASHLAGGAWRGRRRRICQAVRMYELLIANFADSPDPALHKLAVSAKLNRAPLTIMLARPRSAWSAFTEVFALDQSDLAEITTSAELAPGGGYYKTAELAAVIGAAKPRRTRGDDAAAEAIRQDTATRGSVSRRIAARLVRRLG